MKLTVAVSPWFTAKVGSMVPPSPAEVVIVKVVGVVVPVVVAKNSTKIL